MKLHGIGKTDQGLKRSSNQDAFLVEPDLGLFVVADGMGGHSGGEIASQYAVETALEVVRNNPSGIQGKELVEKIYFQANKKIFDYSVAENKTQGMGTTMVVGLIQDDTLYIGNVGDSRAYLYQLGLLWQLTEDHSFVNDQIRQGTLKEDQAAFASNKNMITRAVGFERQVEVDVISRQILEPQSLMICSDGLCGLVPGSEMVEIMKQNHFTNWSDVLIQAALKAGGSDNVTVVCVEFEP